MPKINIAAVPARKGTGYPPPFDAPCTARIRRRLGEAGGLRDFGVNLMTLPPGGWSSQRSSFCHSDDRPHTGPMVRSPKPRRIEA